MGLDYIVSPVCSFSSPLTSEGRHQFINEGSPLQSTLKSNLTVCSTSVEMKVVMAMVRYRQTSTFMNVVGVSKAHFHVFT